MTARQGPRACSLIAHIYILISLILFIFYRVKSIKSIKSISLRPLILLMIFFLRLGLW